ncbi:integrase catalytic domain-containing protein [Trichonephila clavipes]|uniref:Integrase catalytic domain-containing protein n=1 Tax=Trichonephila clavipes TaxID=2585209 RepID=A0A8X6V3Y7_TRICX|nr:integrase catalytic domain-containing protein [Trichonephila clavipes]
MLFTSDCSSAKQELQQPQSIQLADPEFIKPENSTKLRVVFNASCPTSNGRYLNSLQANGGIIQYELFSIIIRFRKQPIAITADIEKMYRMILITPSQRDYLRILWKSDKNDPVSKYRLNTVTYGTTSAPFLATRTLKQIAIDNR